MTRVTDMLCSQAALVAALDNLKLDDSASGWSLDNFAAAVAAHRPSLSWAVVAERLDCPGFAVSSEAAFRRLVSTVTSPLLPCQGITRVERVNELDHNGNPAVSGDKRALSCILRRQLSCSLHQIYLNMCAATQVSVWGRVGEAFPLSAVAGGNVWQNAAGQIEFLHYATAAPPDMFTFAAAARKQPPLHGLSQCVADQLRSWHLESAWPFGLAAW